MEHTIRRATFWFWLAADVFAVVALYGALMQVLA